MMRCTRFLSVHKWGLIGRIHLRKISILMLICLDADIYFVRSSTTPKESYLRLAFPSVSSLLINPSLIEKFSLSLSPSLSHEHIAMSFSKSTQATNEMTLKGKTPETGHCADSPDAWEELPDSERSLKPLPPGDSLPNRVALYLISFLTPGHDPRSWGPLLWDYLLFFTVVHPLGGYAVWLMVSGAVAWQTIATAYLFIILGLLGLLAGAHRLWSHRSYKARLPLALFLALANTMATQWSIYRWAKDHRQHHKYTGAFLWLRVGGGGGGPLRALHSRI